MNHDSAGLPKRENREVCRNRVISARGGRGHPRADAGAGGDPCHVTTAERRGRVATRNVLPARGNFLPAWVRFFRVSGLGRRASEAGLIVNGPGRLATGHFLPARDHFFRVNGPGRLVRDVGQVVSDHFLPVSGPGGARGLRD